MPSWLMVAERESWPTGLPEGIGELNLGEEIGLDLGELNPVKCPRSHRIGVSKW